MGFEEELVEKMREKTYMYDKRQGMYRNQQKKDKMWKEISVELNADETKCRSRWKCLRDQYVRELRKQKGSSGSGALQGSKWKYFDLMHFLRDSVVPRQHSTSYETAFEDSTDNSTELLDADDTFIPMQEDALDNSSFLRELAQYEEGSTSGSQGPTVSTPKIASRAGKTNAPEEDFKTFLNTVVGKMNDEDHEDTTDIFFRSLATSVKSLNLSPLQLLDFQAKILNFINEEANKYNKN